MLRPWFLSSALVLLGGLQQPTPVVTPAARPASASATTAPAAVAPAAAPGIPAEAARMVNPVKPTTEGMEHAKKMYGYDCALCHGASGDGKGELVTAMSLNLKNWTDAAALKDMTDGQLFYIIKNGQGKMTGEGDRAKPDDMWNMVVLVRSFSKH
jgi:mono/diheme cytochrome c family protein